MEYIFCKQMRSAVCHLARGIRLYLNLSESVFMALKLMHHPQLPEICNHFTLFEGSPEWHLANHMGELYF